MEDLKIQMICWLVSEVSLTTRSGAMLLQRLYIKMAEQHCSKFYFALVWEPQL
jgi:hypothetical protein